MIRVIRRSIGLWMSLAVVLCFALGAAAQVGTDLFSGLQWRIVGPFHGGRIAAVTGVVGEPGTFYVGLPQGGIWKTTSGGMTWYPVFDQVTEVDSIGAIQVAPSDPNIIYAGSGDAVAGASTGTNGNGMYKSTDAGKTWKHIGLEGTTRIPKIIVDPKDPNIVIAVAMAGTTGTQRGIFRTDNGGQTWTNVLHLDDETGGRDLSSPFDTPNVIFATTIAEPSSRRQRGRGRASPRRERSNHTKLFKSVDEGKTWTEVTSNPSTTGRIARGSGDAHQWTADLCGWRRAAECVRTLSAPTIRVPLGSTWQATIRASAEAVTSAAFGSIRKIQTSSTR